ncbi:response regulator [Gloeocapsopsis dulcis]|uniref:Response regulator n=1 Tax=Gloeocapsopsis dulcis AAB1 = 1H9 TaxID=1433147 RepID=A0A6N8FQC6_9CHRO|nr:response regulator [Gloeocapsopsis dulcis]MUL34872.1 response regulator [Gloeocapsopsis dulcis AAB1 = 1H9]WNN90059.1 response regulator [Gloeocapsopsis dulcis]
MEVLLASNKQAITQPLILAVDDDEDSLLLLTEVVRGNNFACITAQNGKSALSLAQRYQPDLVLLDILLPDLNGIEVVHHLRKSPQTQLIPIIAVTALAKKEDYQRIMMAGCDGYITKPYMLDDLESVIFNHLCHTVATA